MKEKAPIDLRQMLQTILEHTHILIAYLDPDFNFRMVNKAYAEADARDPSFFPEKNHFSLYPNEENEQIFKKVVKTGKPYFAYAKAFEYAEHPERGVSYWDWSLIPHKDKKGKVTGLVLSLSNVSPRILAEKELHKLHHAVEQSPVTVVITNPEGKIEYVNPKFVQLTGFTAEEAIGKNPRILKSGEHPSKFYKEMWKTIKQGKDWRGEFCNRKKNGDLYWESAQISAIKDEKGHITHFIGIKEDITERKKTEEALRQANLIFENSPVVLFRWKAAEGWPVELVSENVIQFGYTSEELLCGEVPYASLVHPDDLERVAREVKEYSASGAERFQQEYRIITKDGQVCCIDDQTMIERDAHGQITHYQGIVLDITERKRAEEELNRYKKNLEDMVEDRTEELNQKIDEIKKVERKAQQHRQELSHVTRVATIGELTAALAHQLNQPLAAILSNAQAAKRFLESESFDTYEIKEILSSIIAEDLRASEVIKGLRAFLKREEVPLKPININSIIKEALSLMKTEAEIKKITLKMDLDSELPLVLGNRIQLQQVLLNLITNGFEAITGQVSEQHEVVIRTSKQDSKTIRVDVQDSGSGIEEEKLEKIFEPFHTTKSWGMGMGLSINKKIVETHGGKIWARNVSDGGAIFSFTLEKA